MLYVYDDLIRFFEKQFFRFSAHPQVVPVTTRWRTMRCRRPMWITHFFFTAEVILPFSHPPPFFWGIKLNDKINTFMMRRQHSL